MSYSRVEALPPLVNITDASLKVFFGLIPTYQVWKDIC